MIRKCHILSLKSRISYKFHNKNVHLSINLSKKIPSFVDNLKEISTKTGLKCETNTFFQDSNFTETDEFLIKSYDVAFKVFGLKGYIVKIEKSRPFSIQLPQNSSERPYLLPPTLSSDRPQLNAHKSPVSESNRHNLKSKCFSFKYDIYRKSFIGEIYENIENYYDYNMTNRSKIKLETNKSLNISVKQNDSVLITNSDADDSSRNPVNLPMGEDLSMQMRISSKKELQESQLLQKLELAFKETQGLNIKEEAIEGAEERNKIDYSQGLRVLQLFGNRLFDVDDLKKELERSSEEDENEYLEKEDGNEKNKAIVALKEDENEEDIYEDDSSYFENRRKFKTLMEETNKKPFQPIILMHWAGFLLLAALLVMNVVYSTDNITNYSDINDYYNILLHSSRRMTSTQLMFSSTFNLMIMGLGYFQNVDPNQAIIWKTKLNDSLSDLEIEQSSLSLNSMGLSSSDFYIQNLVEMSFFSNNGGNSSELFNLNDATQLIIAKALNVLATDLANLNLQNADVFFLLTNLINDYFVSLDAFNSEIVTFLTNLTNQTSDFLIIIFVIAIIIEFLGILTLSFLFFIIIKYENKVLSLFLEIPIFKAKHHFLKCEAFLIQMQQGNEDEDVYDEEGTINDSEENEEEFKNITNKNSSKYKKRKKYKVKYNNLRTFIVKILISISIVEVFFIVNYFTLKTIFDEQIQFIPEVQETLILNSNIGFTNNAFRFIYNILLNLKPIFFYRMVNFNKDFPTKGQPDNYTRIYEYLTDLTSLFSDLKEVNGFLIFLYYS